LLQRWVATAQWGQDRGLDTSRNREATALIAAEWANMLDFAAPHLFTAASLWNRAPPRGGEASENDIYALGNQVGYGVKPIASHLG
jgi:hypothetical protein